MPPVVTHENTSVVSLAVFGALFLQFIVLNEAAARCPSIVLPPNWRFRFSISRFEF